MAITIQESHCLCDVNDAFHQLTGYSGDEVMGKTMVQLKLWEPASFLKEAEGLLAGRSGFRGRDARIRTEDGGFVDCLISAEVIPLHNNMCALWVIQDRSEEHTSELQSLMRISYAVF